MRPDTEAAREYLNQLRDAHDYLEQIKKDLDSIVPLSANKADGIRTNRGYKASGIRSAERRLSKLEEYDRALDHYIRLQHTIINQIDEIEDAHQAEILFYRYVKFYGLHRTAEEMQMEYRYVSRLHRKALISFSNTHHLTNDKAESANEEQ